MKVIWLIMVALLSYKFHCMEFLRRFLLLSWKYLDQISPIKFT